MSDWLNEGTIAPHLRSALADVEGLVEGLGKGLESKTLNSNL
jgi:hypothetical protein